LAVIGLLYILIVWLWTAYLPGYLLSRALVPEATGGARQGFALLCAFSTVPLLIFLTTVGLGVPMNASFVFPAASMLNIVGLGLLWRRPGGLQMKPDLRLSAGLAVGTLAVGLLLLFGIRSLDGGDVFSTIHHCLYVIVMHAITNDPSSAIPLYDAVSDRVINYLVQHPTDQFNGLASLFYEQRLGNAPLLAGSVALFGSSGWFLTSVFASMVTGVCCWLIGRELGASSIASVAGAAIFVYGTHHFLAYAVNENLYAVALVSFLLWTALRKEMSLGVAVLIGITAGHLVGVRHTSVLFWPAIAAGVLWRPGDLRQHARRFALALALAILFLLPWLYVNQIMLGGILDHPKIHPESTDRVVKNVVMGWSFSFRALNWPFIDSISRTAWNPLPTFLWLPLWAGKCYGQISLALAAVGLWGLRGRRRQWGLLALFAIPHTAAIGLLESLDWEQLTYATPGLVPLGGLMACSLSGLIEPTTRKVIGRQTGLVWAAITLLTLGTASLTFPVDTRILSKVDWPKAPSEDRGVELVGAWLSKPSPLPRRPVGHTPSALSTISSFGHSFPHLQKKTDTDIPIYESSTVAVLAGYSSKEGSNYHFALQGGPLRPAEKKVRTSLGLHMISLRLPAERADISISWVQGVYHVEVDPTVLSKELKDFSIYLHPWFPPARIIRVAVAGQPPADLRVLEYGGSREAGERRFIVTNYDEEVLDVIDVPFTVDPMGESLHCGLFLFSSGIETDRIETLVSAGGHTQDWYGEREGVLSIPRNILADSVVLFAEPYCSDHVPQYGDRYGLATAPFEPEKGLRFRLDRTW
jgi:4-amino-4-deoxy-L-arabinose transferase-like glycosyltransferase